MIVTTLFGIFLTYIILKILATGNRRLPPSPAAALPIIGHLYLLKPPAAPYKVLHRLAQKHGPILSLKFGSRRVAVVSSPELVDECFSRNDVVFSNRPQVLVHKYIGYNYTAISAANYGDHWRALRRTITQELFSPTRLHALARVRESENAALISNLIPESAILNQGGFRKVHLRPKISKMIFDGVMRMIAGKRYFDVDGEGDGDGFRGMIGEFFVAAEASNPEDFVAVLRWMDVRGLNRKLADLGRRLDEFYQKLVEEHRIEKKETIVGHLVALQETDPEFYTDDIIKGIIMAIILGGTETSSVTIEWAMSFLLNNPNVLQKARLEIDNKVGTHRLINEQDLYTLLYLRNIIWETLRLVPPAPLLLPREASADCKVGGYDVLSGTMLMINSWAIQRDPTVWDDPMTFKPERFEGREMNTGKLIPFGFGRRACPGANLGFRMMGLTLGSLIQCFDWERVNGEEIDLTEAKGLTTPKLVPLEAMCKPREVMDKVVQEIGTNL